MRSAMLVAVTLLATLAAHGDSWSLPEPTTVQSADGRWRVTVTPKQLKGQLEYFSDKVADKPDAGAVEGVTSNEPRGELFRRADGGTWQRVARWRLVNEVSPVSALVANNGTVVTFDNWHSMGYGQDVVVIYRPDGTLVRKFSLADFLEEEDINQVEHSVSSIWWSGTHRLDQEKRLLLLEVKAHKIETIPISLDDGSVLAAKRVMFPRPQVTWTAEDVGSCQGGVGLSATEVAGLVEIANAPAYPPVARKVRVGGLVIVDVLIDTNGFVERAEVVKPLPFGLDRAAQDAILKWRFRPLDRGDEPRQRCGRIVVKYDLSPTPGIE